MLQLDLHVADDPGGSVGHSDGHVPIGSTALGHYHGPRPGASPWPSIAIGAADINTDPGCYRATDPDMTLGSSLGMDYTMALGGNTGHPDLCGPGCSIAPRLQQGHRLRHFLNC